MKKIIFPAVAAALVLSGGGCKTAAPKATENDLTNEAEYRVTSIFKDKYALVCVNRTDILGAVLPKRDFLIEPDTNMVFRLLSTKRGFIPYSLTYTPSQEVLPDTRAEPAEVIILLKKQELDKLRKIR